jgi:hypothetical protein
MAGLLQFTPVAFGRSTVFNTECRFTGKTALLRMGLAGLQTVWRLCV